ncbi:hypothetical protein D3C87_1874480 [compost metagenome]
MAPGGMLALAGERVRWSSRVKTRAAVARPSTSSEIEQVASAQLGSAVRRTYRSVTWTVPAGAGRSFTRTETSAPEGGVRFVPYRWIGRCAGPATGKR